MYAPDQSAANHIFTERYHVLIPRSFMFGPEYIRKVGYAVAGDASVDRMQANSLENQRQTIAGLSVLYWQGAEPLLGNEMDCIPIYRNIMRHLAEWRDFTYMGINAQYCPPIQDFQCLEALAMYFHYKVHELDPKPETTDRLHNAVMALNRSGNRSVIRQKTHDEENNIKPFVSIAEDIERNLYGD